MKIMQINLSYAGVWCVMNISITDINFIKLKGCIWMSKLIFANLGVLR